MGLNTMGGEGVNRRFGWAKLGRVKMEKGRKGERGG